MTKRHTICAIIALLILFLSGCRTEPEIISLDIFAQEVSISGTYVHNATGVEFPEHFIPFERVSIWEYDQTGNNIGVGYNLSSIREPASLTLYLYPSSPSCFRDGQWKSMSPAAAFHEHYMDTLLNLLVSCKDPVVLDMKTYTLNQFGQSLTGKRAIVKLTGLFAGYEQECISCLYMFYYKNWFVQYRVTFPSEVYELAQESTENFIRNFPVLPKMISQDF